jgi:hypothetical protein
VSTKMCENPNNEPMKRMNSRNEAHEVGDRGLPRLTAGSPGAPGPALPPRKREEAVRNQGFYRIGGCFSRLFAAIPGFSHLFPHQFFWRAKTRLILVRGMAKRRLEPIWGGAKPLRHKGTEPGSSSGRAQPGGGQVGCKVLPDGLKGGGSSQPQTYVCSYKTSARIHVLDGVLIFGRVGV